MKRRIEVARFIENQMVNTNGKVKEFNTWHYGYIELRNLLDFLYDRKPIFDGEKLKNHRSDTT